MLGRGPSGDTRAFSRLAGYADATADAIVFAQDASALDQALASSAGLILAPVDAVSDDARVFPVKHPKHVFALCGQWFDRFRAAEIADGAFVDSDATVGYGTSIAQGAVVERGAVVGAGCVIGPNVTVYGCVTLGDRVVVQAG